MLVRDDVESGEERMKELEQEMKDWGIFDTDFSLGDVLEELGEEAGEPDQKKPKVKIAEFPAVEGEESVAEYTGQYKKACLSRKGLLKSTKERLDRDKAVGFEPLGFKGVSFSFLFSGVC